MIEVSNDELLNDGSPGKAIMLNPENQIAKIERGIDLGFDLKFNVPLVSITGDFTPPQEGCCDTWQGAVRVFTLDDEVGEKHFRCHTVQELKMQVEKYIKGVTDAVMVASVPF